jgi:hypothetical protein
MTPAPPDGILRHVTDRIWIGTLHGFQVHVVPEGRSWFLPYLSVDSVGAKSQGRDILTQ